MYGNPYSVRFRVFHPPSKRMPGDPAGMMFPAVKSRVRVSLPRPPLTTSGLCVPVTVTALVPSPVLMVVNAGEVTVLDTVMVLPKFPALIEAY